MSLATAFWAVARARSKAYASRSLCRVNPAYYWGISTILISMIITGPLAFTPMARALVAIVRGG